jgi:hypothetical protein
MNPMREILRSLVALFFDDELLALGVLFVVALTALLVLGLAAAPLAAGSFLLVGNVLVLVLGVARTARRRPSP